MSSSAVLVSIRESKISTQLVADGRVVTRTEAMIPLSSEITVERMVSATVGGVKQTLEQLVQIAKRPIQRACLFLPAPFYAAQAHRLVTQAATPFVVNSKLIDGLISQAQTAAATTGHELLESAVLGFSANGYPLTQPHGQLAQRLEINQYLSIAPTQILDTFRSVVANVLHLREIDFYSSGFVLLRVLGLAPSPVPANYLLLELGDEVSELTLLWEGEPKTIVSFPFGGNTLLRLLAQKLGSTPTETRSTVRLYVAGQLASAAAGLAVQAAGVARDAWLAAFTAAKTQVLVGNLLPTDLVVAGEGEVAELLTAWLAAVPARSLIISRPSFKISLLPTAEFNPELVEKTFYDKILATKS